MKPLLQMVSFLSCALLAWFAKPCWAVPPATTFSYQGRLTDGGLPAQGEYDLQFTLYDAETGGTVVAGPIARAPVGVVNGLFTVLINIGAAGFDGNARWVQIGVRPNGSAAEYTALSPRQWVSTTPYAMYAFKAGTAAGLSGTLPSEQLPSSVVTKTAGATGEKAVALGESTMASGGASTALGSETVAGAYTATAMGKYSQATADCATATGFDNIASGWSATAMGVETTAAGWASMATGYRARALHEGTFVWADKQDPGFASTAANQFLIRASGGVGIGTTAPAAALHVAGAVALGNTTSSTPVAGTVRWTGSDFQGYNGSKWVSLTGRPDIVTPVASMVWIWPGTFVMGSPDNEAGHDSEEGPQTMVTLTRGFYLAKFEVTQSEYQAVTGLNPSVFQGDLSRPVEAVLWSEADQYCQTLTEREHSAGRIPATWQYRLPTEAEWEYACRAGTTTRFSYGDDPDSSQLTGYAWFGANSGSVTHPVGQKLPNGWGLHDMHGNVWEWCQDWYGAYPGGSLTDPQGPAADSDRVARGGGWNDDPQYCRAAFRVPGDPAYPYSDVGFRVALVPVP